MIENKIKNKFPLDCLKYIITCLNSSETFRNIFNTSKYVRYSISDKCYCTINIVFTSFEYYLKPEIANCILCIRFKRDILSLLNKSKHPLIIEPINISNISKIFPNLSKILNIKTNNYWYLYGDKHINHIYLPNIKMLEFGNEVDMYGIIRYCQNIEILHCYGDKDNEDNEEDVVLYQSLIELKLINKRISAEMLVEIFTLKKLKVLALSSIELDTDIIDNDYFKDIIKLKHLEVLDISDNVYYNNILPHLNKIPSLRELDITKNGGNSVIIDLKQIKILRISNPLYYYINYDNITCLYVDCDYNLPSFKKMPSLQKLVLDGKVIYKSDFKEKDDIKVFSSEIILKKLFNK